MKYTIFSIDGEDAFWNRDIFESQFRSSVLTKGALMPMKGSYKGVEEYSWICLSEDFNKFVQPTGFVVNQESILRVSECNKKYTVLVKLQGGEQTHLGCMKSVTEAEAKAQDAWSYRIDLDQYFITVDGNNDHPSIPEVDHNTTVNTQDLRDVIVACQVNENVDFEAASITQQEEWAAIGQALANVLAGNPPFPYGG